MNKKKLLISLSILSTVITAGIISGIFLFNKKKTTVIGFYDLPDSYIEVLSEVITGDTNTNFQFIRLTEENLLSSDISKKVDIIFSYNSANTKELMNSAISLPNYLSSKIPATLKSSNYYSINGNVKVLPIAMDLFETLLLKTAVNKYEIPVPEKVSKFVNFGRTSKFYYPIPFFIAGNDDITISSLLSLLVASYGGKSGYENVISQLSKTSDFSEIYNYKIGGDADESVTISTLLNIIKEWQDNNYLTKGWTNFTAKQISSLIDDNRVDLGFMNLSDQRKITVPNIYYYTTLDFPVESANVQVSIQPVIVGLRFTDKEETRLAFNRLSQEKAQEYISLKTKLGPAMLRGTSCDIQADDARYIAASTEGGPVPDLGTAAFKTKEQRHLFAEAIRNYFQ